MSQHFPKSRRLKNSADFQRVFGRGKSVSGKFWRVMFADNGQNFARLGLAISKKICPRAVARNRLKRMAREVFRREENLRCFDFVIIAKNSNADKNAKIAELKTLFRRA